MHTKTYTREPKTFIRKNVTVTFYNEKEQLYLETDTSDVNLRTSLLQGRNILWFLRNEAPENAALWPILFESTSLTSAEIHYNNIEKESWAYSLAYKNVTTTAFPMKSEQ